MTRHACDHARGLPPRPMTHSLSEAQHFWLADAIVLRARAEEELLRRGAIIRQELSEKHGVPVAQFAPQFRLDDTAQRLVLDVTPDELPA